VFSLLSSKKISIIIPVFNAVTTLPKALQSVLNQSFADREIIIVDGGSTDGTVDYLKGLPNGSVIWISGKDEGIYDAMNKGVSMSSGEWIYFLGADDELAVGILETIAPKMASGYQVVFGDVKFENGYRMVSYLKLRTWLQNTLHHQSAFYSRSLFVNFHYDISFRIMSDYELNLLVYSKSLPTLYIPVIIALCHSGGASSQWTLGLEETNLIRERFIKSRLKSKALSLILSLYYVQKQLRKRIYGHKI